MYNFTISSLLKAWIDQIVRPGKTVIYGPGGPKGLLTGKKVVVLTARGGAYSNGSPRAAYDYQEPYLRAIFAYIGLTDVTFIHAENRQRADQAKQSREAALGQIAEFVAATSEASLSKMQTC
jgi:FMN-dependent NADH-azoreductase